MRTSRAPHPNATEVTAQEWWRAFTTASSESGLLDGVQAMAVAGQQHGMVTLDQSGQLVRDALLWNDNRSESDAEDLIRDLGGRAAWADAVGSVPVASMTVTKIRWLARCEPDNAARTTAVMLPHDWLTWQLGGRSFDPVTDRGDASGTHYFDPTAGTLRRYEGHRRPGELLLPAPDDRCGAGRRGGSVLTDSDGRLGQRPRRQPGRRSGPRRRRAGSRPVGCHAGRSVPLSLPPCAGGERYQSVRRDHAIPVSPPSGR